VKAQNVDVDFPADSFFDVFFEVETTLPSPLDRLHNADPLRMRQVIDCIPPVGAIYQPPPGGQRVPLYDAAGNQIGTLVHAQHEVPSVWCGDGVVDPSIGEQCDDGNTADCDGCDRNCKLTACGNNIICPPEQCDDGNTTPGDGCDAACQIEAPMATPTATATSTPSRTPTLTPTPTGTLAVLRVGNVVMRPGQQHVGVPLFLDNNLKVRALQFALTDVPDEVVLSATTPACSTTSRSSGLALDCNETGGAIRGVLLSTGTATIAPGSGSIATVFVDDTAPSCALGQTIQLNLSDTAVADDNSNPVPHTTVNGTLRCGCPEDLNCDTRVDIFDALICVDLILGRDPERCADSDLDCNGRTDIFDCLLIVDSILGRRPACE
jgi:cysteine-rich repeat protein